jgi:hypothetical protein
MTAQRNFWPRCALEMRPFSYKADVMNAKQREVAESVFDKNMRREAEIRNALQQEHARHEAVIENMHRLRLLRLQRDAQTLKPH